MRRVVVTGMGGVTPIGNNVKDFWCNLVSGKNGISVLDTEEFADSPVKLAATIKHLDLSSLPKRDVKFDAKFTNLARIAGHEAWKDAELNMHLEDNKRIGVYISTSIGSIETLTDGINQLKEKGANRVSPYFLQSVLPNTAAAKVSIDLGAKGGSMCHAASCASGSISIGEAFLKIKNNDADIFVAGAADASITPITLAGFAAMRAIYMGDDQECASIPFNKNRSGFLIGEGAGILVLEELSHALDRGAKIYAEIIGYANNSDAFNMVSPDYEGLSSKETMKKAIDCAGISIDDLDYINAHGTSTVLGDRTEARAIHEIWGDNCPLVSSIKSQIGHLLSASGAVEAIATILMLKNNHILNGAYKIDLDEDCALNVPQEGQRIDVKYALSNSFGFGGHNAGLIFKKWDER